MISQQSVTASFPVKADAVLAACCVCTHSGIALSPSPGQWAATWGGGPGQPPATQRGDPATEPRLPPLQNGVISLIDCTLVEEQESTDEDGRCPRGPVPVRLLLGHAQGPAQPPPVGTGWGGWLLCVPAGAVAGAPGPSLPAPPAQQTISHCAPQAVLGFAAWSPHCRGGQSPDPAGPGRCQGCGSHWRLHLTPEPWHKVAASPSNVFPGGRQLPCSVAGDRWQHGQCCQSPCLHVASSWALLPSVHVV